MENNELMEALRMKIEALEMKNEAMAIKVEALEMKNQHLQLLLEGGHGNMSSDGNGEKENENTERPAGKKRGRKPMSQAAKLQVPMEAEVREILSGERYNKATYKAITGILLCLFEYEKANVNKLHEFIGGSRVTIVRHTTLMKKLDLLRYEGSRKKGNYVLTDKGKALVERVAAQR